MIAELATVLCLSTVVYTEARGEPLIGQTAVAHVVINRSKKYNRPVCSVAWHKNQFSGMRVPSKRIRNSKSFKQAEIVAANVYYGKSKDPTNGSLYFHANYVNPAWASKLKHKATYGNHLFYR